MSSPAPVTRSVSVPDLASPDRIAHRQVVNKVFSLVRTLSGHSLVRTSSPALGHSDSPTSMCWQDGPRMPLFPLPPPIVAAASPSSFGADSDGDCDELLQHSLGGSMRYSPRNAVGFKRLRSFGGSRPSLLGPSRASPGLSGGVRPPPIHTAASLDPGLSGSFSDAIASPVPSSSHAAPKSRPTHTNNHSAAGTSGGADDAAGAMSTPTRSSSIGIFGSSGAGLLRNPQVLIPPSPADSAFSYPGSALGAAAGLLPPPATPVAGRSTPLSSASGSAAGGYGRAHGRRVCARHTRSSVPPMSLVAPSLFVGDESAAADWPLLRAAGVTHILNCTPAPSVLEGSTTTELGYGGEEGGGMRGGSPPLRFCQLGLLDSISDLPRMQEALHVGVGFIREAIANGGVVLVHCHRGISRSATLAIAYLVQHTHQTAETVFEHMRTRRRVIDPNLTYWTQLIEWERTTLPGDVLAKQGSSSTPSRSSPACTSRAAPPSPSVVVRPLSRVG